MSVSNSTLLENGPSLSSLGQTNSAHPKERKKISTACNECKRRKRKCVPGAPPCPPCRVAGIDCTFAEDEDKRKRSNRRHTIDLLEQQKTLLENLLSILRHGNDVDVGKVVQLVRSEISPKDLGEQLERAANRNEYSPAQSRTKPSPLSTGSVSSSGATASTKTSSQFSARIRAATWSTVTCDDDFVSDLLTLYLTWQHPCLHLFRVDYLIEAAEAEDLRSHFCSPLLMNVMFAIACVSHF